MEKIRRDEEISVAGNTHRKHTDTHKQQSHEPNAAAFGNDRKAVQGLSPLISSVNLTPSSLTSLPTLLPPSSFRWPSCRRLPYSPEYLL